MYHIQLYVALYLYEADSISNFLYILITLNDHKITYFLIIKVLPTVQKKVAGSSETLRDHQDISDISM